MLLFVYNEDSTIFNKSKGFAQKVLFPASYYCNLCCLTKHSFGERESWKKFKQRTNHTLKFMYRDQFDERFLNDFNLPAIFIKEGGEWEMLISAEEIDRLDGTKDLISLIEYKTESVLAN